MQEQDKRAVESMCGGGLDLKGVISVFPKLPGEEIVAIYKSVNGRGDRCWWGAWRKHQLFIKDFMEISGFSRRYRRCLKEINI